MAKSTSATKTAKKKAPAQSPLVKAVKASLASGKALDRAKLKHAANLAAIKQLENKA